MTELTFEKFPKIGRIKRGCVITEKLDGTNAQVVFDNEGNILCGSRNRIITPEDDNYGFASWAYTRQKELFELLGHGRHYGEWWGHGIQRGYGMTEKRFSLFNTARWGEGKDDPAKLERVDGLDVVPTLYTGEFNTLEIDRVMEELAKHGSYATDGCSNPEGIVVYHTAIRQMFKITFEHDKTGKPE